MPGEALARTCRVWEKVEIVLRAEPHGVGEPHSVGEGEYANPYTDVEVWVDLEGPGFRKRCYGFWD